MTDDEELRKLAKEVLAEEPRRSSLFPLSTAGQLAQAVLDAFPDPCAKCGRSSGVLCLVDEKGAFVNDEKTPGAHVLCDPCLTDKRAALVAP